MEPKLFLFDVDGTLVTTGGAGLRALETTFRDLYKVTSLFPSLNPAGKTDFAIFREVIANFLEREARPGELDSIAAYYLDQLRIEMEMASALRVCQGIYDTLGMLSVKPNVLLGLGTGNLERGARLKLNPTGLNAFFPFGGFGSDAEDRSQLLKVGWERAEQRLNSKIPPDRVFIVGDTLLDIQAARKIGVQAIAVATGGVAYDVLQNGNPDFLFHDMTESWSMLKKL